jgi:signal transduction histidine kinase/DNA-binding NarL/FixJ family response regulator
VSNLERSLELIEKIYQGIQNESILHQDKIAKSLKRQMNLSFFSILLALFMLVIWFKLRAIEESARDEMIIKLERLRQDAESASALKSKFLSIVSHEMRTPLNGVIGLADALSRTLKNPDNIYQLGLIKKSGGILLRIINDILDFSKIEAGGLSLTKLECDLKDLCFQIISTFQPAAKQKGITLILSMDPHLPKWVKTDSDRLGQVLFNLFGNAVKFTSQGQVSLKLEPVPGAGRNVVRFSVRDTGMGISKVDMEKLFIPFMQIKSSGTSGEPGTGLGLSISKSIIEALGGRLQFESAEGAGSHFYFDIHFDVISDADVGDYGIPQFGDMPSHNIEAESEIAYSSLPLEGRPSILIVEDNPTNQIVTENLLKILGCDFMSVGSGEEALRMLMTLKFDLILMDNKMPGLSGVETALKIREMKLDVPIVAISADVFPADIKAFTDAGINSYIAKPYTLDQLRAPIEKLLASRGQEPTISSESKEVRIDPLVPSSFEKSMGVEARQRIYRSFCESLSELEALSLEQIRALPNQELKKIAHKYKGSCRLVGLNSIASMFYSAETSEELELSVASFAKAREELVRVKPELSALT